MRRRRSEGLSNDWSAVAAHFPGRTALGCQKRWYQHVRAPDERRASGEGVEGDEIGEGEVGAVGGLKRREFDLFAMRRSMKVGTELMFACDSFDD